VEGAIVAFAEAYADQNERDHATLDRAVKQGKVKAVFEGPVTACRRLPCAGAGDCVAAQSRIPSGLRDLDPEVIVPGHGPVCGIEGVTEMRAYLEYVRSEARASFDAGLTSLEAARRIEFGPYGEWRAPARLFMNVERAYREFRRAGRCPLGHRRDVRRDLPRCDGKRNPGRILGSVQERDRGSR
jgi:hypothetical protein